MKEKIKLILKEQKQLLAGKTTTNKTNAKLGLIGYYATQGPSLDNAPTGISYNPAGGVNNGLYWDSYSQNAIWKLWKSWYDTNHSTLRINSKFNRTSSPVSNSAANSLLRKADTYYEEVTGESGVKFKTNNSEKNYRTRTKVNTIYHPAEKDSDGNVTKEEYYTYEYEYEDYQVIGPITPTVKGSYTYGVYDYDVTGSFVGYTKSDPGTGVGTEEIIGETKSNLANVGLPAGITNGNPNSGDKMYLFFSTTQTKVTVTIYTKTRSYNGTIDLYKLRSPNYTCQNLAIANIKEEVAHPSHSVTINVDSSSGDISLQKYVCKVERDNKNVYSSEERKDKKYNGSDDTPITKGVAPTTFPNGGCKSDNPVEILPGDTVTYKIIVYNNDTANHKATITDRIIDESKGAELVGIYNSANQKYTEGEYSENNTEYSIVNNVPGYKYMRWKTWVSANGSKTFYVKVKYKRFIKGNIINKVYLAAYCASEIYKTYDYDYIKFEESDISLQKRICNVNGTDFNQNYERSNRPVSENDDDQMKHITNSIKASGTPKEDDPVYIEAGDTVTYAITIYNNGNYNENVKIRDYIPEESTDYWGYGGNWEPKTTLEGKYTLETTLYIPKGGNVTVYVCVKYGSYREELTSVNSINEANIIGTDYGNSSEHRTEDADFIRMKTYAVSLQKIVKSVNGSTTGFPNINRWNSWESTANINNSPTSEKYNRNELYAKHNNPVTLEQGDDVTYTIRIRNDGGIFNTSVNITTLNDWINDNTGGNLNFEKWFYGGAFTVSATYNGRSINCRNSNNGRTLSISNDILLKPNQYIDIDITGKVKMDNISTRLLQNCAKIQDDNMKNRNGVTVPDITKSNNDDKDYIQMKDIDISGNVWNDKALDKQQDNYNGLFDDKKENKLSGIKVYLYRNNIIKTTAVNTSLGKVVSIKYTDSNGNYKFTAENIGYEYSKDGKTKKSLSGLKLDSNCAKYIKAPYICKSDYSGTVEHGSNYWDYNNYYNYYVIFEYDGLTYTSTLDSNKNPRYVTVNTNLPNNYEKDSNAAENNGNVQETRQEFNNKFGKITEKEAQYNGNEDIRSMGLEYTTYNKQSYIPQSNHVYNPSTMAMQSSTNLIQLSENANLEEQLKYVNLGLRGRDIFDLELVSDVSKVDVKVNNQQGVYNYSNKITIRNSDARATNIKEGEDMANISSEESNTYVENRTGEEGQLLSNTDLNTSATYTHTTESPYGVDQGLQDIKVTYKITVTNASQTNGIATVITDYYDKCYINPQNAYLEIETKNGTKKSTAVEIKNNDTRNTKYNKVNLHVKNAIEEILGDNGLLTQSQSYNLYFTVTMTNDGINELKRLFKDNKELAYPTYNMAEIRKYKTACGENQTEYTRGLIDKDSAPGSAEETEKVRLTTTESNITQETEGDPSTVEYYFSKKLDSNKNNENYLKVLKYEDDTYATPTLYFTSNIRERKIEGTVFEDYTEIINTNDENDLIRTKTGNGIQDGDEPGIEGVTVQLLEKVSGNTYDYQNNDGEYVIRYSTKTNEEGKFKFEGFLPGKYIIHYKYGDIDETFLYGRYGNDENENNVNSKSYNGEDFQSTNNAYDVDNADIHKLNRTKNFWYAFNKNEGISSAEDNSDRRKQVSTWVTNFSDDQMTVLNNARDGKAKEEIKDEHDKIIKEACTVVNGETGVTITADNIAQGTDSDSDGTYMFADTPEFTLSVEETVELSKIKNVEDLIKNKKIRVTDSINKKYGEWVIFPDENSEYKEYNVSNMNFGIAEVPVTTIDLQKHVYSLEITDSSGDNTIAKAQIDKDNTQVTVNPSKIPENKLNVVINVLSKDLNINKEDIIKKIDYENNRERNTNIIIKHNANKTEIKNLQYDMTMYSLAREITITKKWNVKGDVQAPPGATVLNIQIEDEKLQGAKLEVTYEVTSSVYAEKNFNNDAVTIPSILGIADYIDNDLSYNEEKVGTQPKANSHYWTLAKQEDIAELYKQAANKNEYDETTNEFVEVKNNYGNRLGTLDPEGKKYTTIVTANGIDGGLLLKECGTGTAYITLERVLSSTDSTIEDIIQSSINTYEYDNKIELTGIDYKNTTSESTGDFIFRDRVRTADRYIILAGRQHDAAASETIAIFPPTGENKNINYYIIALISLGVLTIGIELIKKYAIKKDKK